MNIVQSFKLAIKSILANKMRSFLTMLGIIIGVAAVIILVSIVTGYMGSIIDSFESVGANKINVNLRNLSTRYVTDDEMYEFWDEHENWFNALSPVVNLTSATVKSEDENLTSTQVIGVSEDYKFIQKYEIEEGRELYYADIANRSPVCIVGSYVSNEFFGSAEKALNSNIKINGKNFKIIGIVETQDEDNFTEGGTDDFVWIPYTIAMKMSRNGRISSFIFNSADTTYTDEITNELKSVLYKKFKNDRLYTVFAASSIIKELNKQVGTLTLMLGGIAGISLLVAGIGVMNIMLVSVTERTREIGIRKAIGARNGIILQQFIIEAAVTSMIGGIMGIILGAIVTSSVGKAIGVDCSATVGSVLLSFGVSVAIGLLFGYLPAKNASKLNPIDALKAD